MPKQRETLTMEEHVKSPGTMRKYEAHLARFDKWLKGRELTDETLALYLIYLFEKGLAPSTANVAVNAVRWRCGIEDQPDPHGRKSRATLRNFHRKGYERGYGQVDGVMWEDADKVVSLALKDKNLYGLRDAALIAIGSDAMLRVGEITAIEVDHVDFDTKLLTIPRSKTDQEGKGAVEYLGDRTRELVRAWMDKAKIKDGYLFRQIHKDYRVLKSMLGPESIRKIIKARCKAAGIEGRVSGHSLRVGGAQSMGIKGATPLEMQLVGRWKSPNMPYHYAQKVVAKQSPVARLRYGSGS